jgi:tRNA pseudouridine55 synthase
VNGAVYLLDKGTGITSRRAAMAVAKANGFKKYGHCGTLDPDATGLLVVALGKATRLAPYISGETKRYSFDLVTGILTDTLDMSGTVITEADNSHLRAETVVAALSGFTGTFLQKVPLFSAVRVDGERGYKLARKGETPEMPVRQVTVADWQAGEFLNGRIKLEVTVSAGTYIRSLARDIGEALGVPSVADSIRRTRSGVFSVSEASELENCKSSFLSMAEAMREYSHVVAGDEETFSILHGLPIPSNVPGTVAVLNSSGNLVAVAFGDGEFIQPRAVLALEEPE